MTYNIDNSWKVAPILTSTAPTATGRCTSERLEVKIGGQPSMNHQYITHIYMFGYWTNTKLLE